MFVTGIRRIVIACIVFFLLLQAWQAFVNIPWWRLTDIHVEGTLYWPENVFMQQLSIPEGKSIFIINTHELKKQLEKLPQVKQAKVYRALPSTIVCDIVERRPWARTLLNGTLVVLDEDGSVLNLTGVQLIGVEKLIEFKGINSLSVLEPFAKKFKQSVEKLQNCFPEQQLTVEVIGPYEINVRVNKQLLIIWGMEDRVEDKARVLKAVLPVIKGQWRRVGYIDVRSPKNVAIKYL